MKRILSAILATAMCLSLVACGGGASSGAASSGAASSGESGDKAVTIKLGWAETAERSGHALSEAAYTFKETVEALNSSITVELYPAAQLGDAASMLTQVDNGSLEACMSISNGQFATSYYPDLGFLDIPYMFESAQEAYDLLEPTGDFFKDLQADIVADTGIRPLVFFNEGLRHITNSKREITKPEDVAGLKIRTMSVTAHMKMFEALGALPTNVSWGELYTALQTNLVDGQENPIANAVYISAWEVQDYMTLDGHVCLCGLFCMNEEFYQSLSDAQKAAVDQGALKALEAEYAMYSANEAANLQKLKDEGLKVTELTSEQIAAFRDACQPQVLEYLRGAMDTPELLDKAIKAVEDNRG